MPKIHNFEEDNLIWNTKAFPNKLTPEEDIVLVVREDITIIMFKLVGYFLIFLSLLFCRVLLSGIPNFTFISLYDSLFYTINIGLVLAFAYNFHNYYLSLQIVTNKRVIDIDQRGIFNREVNELPIEKIEDVTYRQKDIFSVLFGFGTVSVQTAAEISSPDRSSDSMTGGFVFENVPAPAEIHSIISNLFHKAIEREAHQNAQLQAKYMSEMMQNHNTPNMFNTNPIRSKDDLEIPKLV
jgi:Bacterial PH domain